MTKRITTLILTLAVLAGMMSLPALAKQSSGAPKIVIVEPVGDVGSVPKGDKVDFTYTVRNDGDADLVLTNIKPSCGCTLVEGAPQTIAPGKTGAFTLSVDTNRVSGAFSKTATITSNDPVQKQVKVTIKGTAKEFMQVVEKKKPRIIYQGQTAEFVWEVINNDDAPMDISRVSTNNAGVTATFETVTPGRVFRVKAVTGKNVKKGVLDANVVLITTSKKQPKVTLKARASIQSRVTSSFSFVLLNATKAQLQANPNDTRFRKKVLVKKHVGGGLAISKVEATLPFINTTVEEVEAGKSFYVNISLDKDAPTGPYNGVVTIHTNDKDTAPLEVKVKGSVN